MKTKQRIVETTMICIFCLQLMGCGSLSKAVETENNVVQNQTNAPLLEETADVPYHTIAEQTLSDGTETEVETFEMEQIRYGLNEVKREVLRVYPGNEAGQVRYEAWPSGNCGPESFSVEGDVVYLLDSYNMRINIYENGKSSYIEVGNVYRRMKCQSGYIVLFNNDNSRFAVYEKDGSVKIFGSYSILGADRIDEVLGVGETYLEYMKWKSNMVYRYDWTKGTVKEIGEHGKPIIYSELPIEENYISYLGTHDQSVYYQYYDFEVGGFIVNKERGASVRMYTEISLFDWYITPLEPVYFSSDGRVYLMECLGECTVISELMFDK